MKRRIGFIGLGQMGKWMALNLLKADCQVRVFDIDSGAVNFLVENGAASGRTPGHVAAEAEMVFLSLPNTEIVEQVIFGDTGLVQAAEKEMLIVDLSTISYLRSVEMARKLSPMNIHFCDAPVSEWSHAPGRLPSPSWWAAPHEIFERIRPPAGNHRQYGSPHGPGGLGSTDQTRQSDFV